MRTRVSVRETPPPCATLPEAPPPRPAFLRVVRHRRFPACTTRHLRAAPDESQTPCRARADLRKRTVRVCSPGDKRHLKVAGLAPGCARTVQTDAPARHRTKYARPLRSGHAAAPPVARCGCTRTRACRTRHSGTWQKSRTIDIRRKAPAGRPQGNAVAAGQLFDGSQPPPAGPRGRADRRWRPSRFQSDRSTTSGMGRGAPR